MASQYLPPGWPAQLPPPGAGEFHDRVVAWLLDLGPADFRGYRVFRNQPQVLAWAVASYLEAALQASRTLYSTTRREFAEQLTPVTVSEVLNAIEFEGVRLRRALREVTLVQEALAGRQWSARL